MVVTVELWVALTTALLVAMLAAGAAAPPPRVSRAADAASMVALPVASFMVFYTLGLIQYSSSRESGLVQGWAVLVATLHYGVVTSSLHAPADEVTVSDLLSLLWTANLLRSYVAWTLKAPLLLVWMLNAARVVAFSSTSRNASTAQRRNVRLISNYMGSDYSMSTDPSAADPATMNGYDYLVLGEERQKLEGQAPSPGGFSDADDGLRLRLDDPELVTVEMVWRHGGDIVGGDPDNRLKDACLSFALAKLLRCRFYGFPSHEHEARRGAAARRLVLDYILREASGEGGGAGAGAGYERALRVTGLELRFLRQMFYTKHGVFFARGFPARRLLLSLLLVAALAVLVCYPGHKRLLEEEEEEGDVGAYRHPGVGVALTYTIVAIIVAKELWETSMYMFSHWTKVLIICHLVKREKRRSRSSSSGSWCPSPAIEKAAAAVICRSIAGGGWDQKVGQYNLLLAADGGVVSRVKLPSEAKAAIFGSLRALLLHGESTTGSYLANAFGTRTSRDFADEVSRVDGELESNMHRILVWHLATCVSEISLTGGTAAALGAWWLRPRPLVPESSTCAAAGNGVGQHYVAAVSLSNYCAYLLAGRSGHVLFSGELLRTVVGEVAEAAAVAGSGGSASIGGVRDELVSNAWAPDGPDGGTMAKMAARLSEQLRVAHGSGGAAALWASLAGFWAGFLLHLAASTDAAVHKEYLRGEIELTTHLWALLSHAGI